MSIDVKTKRPLMLSSKSQNDLISMHSILGLTVLKKYVMWVQIIGNTFY